jgi:hypothetical protein
MILQEALETIAHTTIPDGNHKYLHVNSREAWVNTVLSMVESSTMDPTPKNIKKLVDGWETLLFVKYSSLN